MAETEQATSAVEEDTVEFTMDFTDDDLKVSASEEGQEEEEELTE